MDAPVAMSPFNFLITAVGGFLMSILEIVFKGLGHMFLCFVMMLRLLVLILLEIPIFTVYKVYVFLSNRLVDIEHTESEVESSRPNLCHIDDISDLDLDAADDNGDGDSSIAQIFRTDNGTDIEQGDNDRRGILGRNTINYHTCGGCISKKRHEDQGKPGTLASASAHDTVVSDSDLLLEEADDDYEWREVDIEGWLNNIED